MKGLFWILALFGLAVAVALGAGLNDGYVLLVEGGHALHRLDGAIGQIPAADGARRARHLGQPAHRTPPLPRRALAQIGSKTQLRQKW